MSVALSCCFSDRLGLFCEVWLVLIYYGLFVFMIGILELNRGISVVELRRFLKWWFSWALSFTETSLFEAKWVILERLTLITCEIFDVHMEHLLVQLEIFLSRWINSKFPKWTVHKAVRRTFRRIFLAMIVEELAYLLVPTHRRSHQFHRILRSRSRVRWTSNVIT